jgi:hypothetical protein
MFRKVTFALILGILFFSSVRAEEFISPLEAKDVALQLIQQNVAYYALHPQKSGNIPEWRGAELGDPILAHTYPDLKPCYYVVPVVNPENEIISLIGTSAKSQQWQWFSRIKLEKFPKVGESQASKICEARIQNIGVSAPKIVEMPDKKLYWHFLTGDNQLKEVFINIDDASEVHTNLDPDVSELTTGHEPAPIYSPSDQKVGKSHQKIDFLYPDSYDIVMPFYYQETSWYCGEAALKMVFDYWGPAVSQTDIGDVANENISYGTYSDDLRRASHFSYISTAIQNPSLQGYNERDWGYSGNEVFWSEPSHYPDRFGDLKNLISNDYPILVLTWYSSSHNSGHFRVVKGYDNSLNHFIVHDPWYSAPYYGPNVHFNQTFFVDDLWVYSGRWGLLSAPWKANISAPPVIYTNELVTVDASFTYTAFHPFESQFLADSLLATIILPPGYQLLSPPSSTIYFGSQYSGFVGNPSWQIQAPSDSSGPDTIRMEVKGKVTGSSYSYWEYQDWIGGETKVTVTTVSYVRGDLNKDHVIELGDVVYLISYLYKSGELPSPL